MSNHIDPAKIIPCQPPTNKNFDNISGRRFGRLVVQALAGRIMECGYGRYCWLCLCDCGRTALVKARTLKDGATQSCGCFQSEGVAARNFKHGLCSSDEYQSWVVYYCFVASSSNRATGSPCPGRFESPRRVEVQKTTSRTGYRKTAERCGCGYGNGPTSCILLSSNGIAILPFEARLAIVQSYLRRYATDPQLTLRLVAPCRCYQHRRGFWFSV